MKPSDRHLIERELSWLHEDPHRVAELLTDEEAKQVVRQGFICGTLWNTLQKRLKVTC